MAKHKLTEIIIGKKKAETYSERRLKNGDIWVKPTKYKRPKYSKMAYGGRWRKERDAWLEKHPKCAMCGKPAESVDHIIPHRGDNAVFWDKENWQSLCWLCHRKKTGMGL